MQKATGDVAAHFQFDASISPRYKYSAARDCVTDPRNGDCAIQALERLEPIAQKQVGNIFDWAGQSYELAVVDAYGKLPPIDMNYEYQDRSGKTQKGGYRLGDEYYKANNDVVEEQLRLGGVRLARVLNEILSAGSK